MEWIEVTAKTVESAVELALDSLGVHESELEYEIVEHPRSGFLGIGRGHARIRARVKPISREKPQDRRRRKRNEQRRGPKPERSAHQSERAPKPARAPAAANDNADAGGAADGAGGAGGARRSRNRRRKPAGTDPARSGSPAAERRGSNSSKTQGDPDMADATISVEEQLNEAREFTDGLIEAFGLPASVRAAMDDDDIQVDIDGDNLGVLVGPKGATLSAIEELVRTAVLVRAGGFGARIHVDVAGYRRKRKDALAGFATKLAAEVVASGVAKALEPMSAADRKVVHDTVAEIDGVATSSEGEDPRRRVVIRPA